MQIALARCTRWLSWHRRPVAAAAAALAVLSVTAALRPPEPVRSPVVVAAAGLPGGHRLGAGDLTLAHWPVELVPDATVTDPDALIGRTLAAPLAGGSPISELSVVSERSASATAGMVVAPVRLNDAELVSLLRPGERVDLLGVDPAGSTAVIASAVRLVSVPAPAGTSGGLGPSGPDASLILVEVSPQSAIALTAAANAGPISAVLR